MSFFLVFYPSWIQINMKKNCFRLLIVLHYFKLCAPLFSLFTEDTLRRASNIIYTECPLFALVHQYAYNINNAIKNENLRLIKYHVLLASRLRLYERNLQISANVSARDQYLQRSALWFISHSELATSVSVQCAQTYRRSHGFTYTAKTTDRAQFFVLSVYILFLALLVDIASEVEFENVEKVHWLPTSI